MKNIPFDLPLPQQSPQRLPRQAQLKRLQTVAEEVLTPMQRQTLLDYYYHQKGITQIAKDRGVHRSTVWRTLIRAHKNLQEHLKY